MRSILLAAAMALTAQAEAPKPPDLALESYRLANGLKVALHRDPTVPRVTVAIGYHVGSKNEKAGRTGFAHFFEHMMFRGTKNVPNYDIPLQEAGAGSNAFTSEDMTVYFETVPSNFLERALYLEAERLAFLPSALDQSKFDTEREVVKNERRQSFENPPYGLDGETILAHLFPEGHPYSWSVIGSMGDLGKATLDDLRRFFGAYYHPGNATLCLVGDFDPKAARAMIEKYFGPLAPGPRIETVAIPDVPPRSQALVRYDRVKLPRVYWNWPTVADDHPDAPALDLLARVLAGGETSRLHKQLVLDTQLCSEVSADSDAKESAGLFTIEATTANAEESESTLSKIEAAIGEALAEVAKTPPSRDEVARALAVFEKSAYAGLTPPLGRAVTLILGFAQNDDPEHYKKDFARYFRVTPEDLTRVAGRYLGKDKLVLKTLPADAGHPRSEAAVAGPKPSDRPEGAFSSRPPSTDLDWTKMPGPSDPVPFQAPKFTRRRLSNGIDAWVVPWKTLPLVSVRVVIPAGTADGTPGLASLTASLLTQGTRDRTATELAEALEVLGVTLGASASSDEISTGFTTVSRNLSPTLKILGEVLARPRFDPKDFSRERDLQIAALLQGSENPNWIARRVFPALLYGASHPYAKPADGAPESVKALTLDDVTSFHRAHVGRTGAIVVVVGDVEADAVFTALEKTLEAWPAQTLSPKPRDASAEPAKPDVVYFVDKPGAVQSVVTVGRRWVDRSDDSYLAALVGNRILGGDFLSRLNQNLRERNGFTYGAGSTFRFRRTGSVWSVGTQVRTDATAPALKEILAELDGLAAGKPFTTEEIETALGAELKSFPEGFESPGSIAGILEEMAQFGLPPDYLDTYLGRLQATRPETIGKTMARVVSADDRVTLIVGDRAAVEPKLRELGFGKIQFVDQNGRPLP